jgi:hypothetical protein
VMVAVWKIRSMWVTAEILMSATDAIRWGTLHGIVQVLHEWRQQHQQRQPQQRRQYQLRTIGWQSLAYPLKWRAGTWIVPQLLTCAEISESSNGIWSIPKTMGGIVPGVLNPKKQSNIYLLSTDAYWNSLSFLVLS